MTLEEAKDYINYGIKEGAYDEDLLEGWDDEKIISFAEEEESRAQAYYDSSKEEDGI